MRKLVSIIIVNWNGQEHLAKCLLSLSTQSYKKIEVILVDNGSDDSSVEWVRKNFPKTRILINNKNIGFAQANNIGYKTARGEYILFLNNDTRVTKNFLVKLLKVLKSNEQIGGVQPKILFMDDPKRFDAIGSFLTYTGFLYHYGVYKIDLPKYNKQIEIFSAKGACMMFKRSVLEATKFGSEIFDKRYFAYFEETDLCHRIWLAGYKIVFVPTSVIYHKYGATSQRLLKPFIEYHSYKNRISSYIKNLGAMELLKILPAHLAICVFLSVFFLIRGQLQICLAIWRAIFWNIQNIKASLIWRQFVQRKIRKVEDDIILPRVQKNPNLNYYFSHIKGWNTTQIDVKVNS